MHDVSTELGRAGQLPLFEGGGGDHAEDAAPAGARDEESGAELKALDELFLRANHYRRSREYLELLRFLGRFTDYSPFNATLVHTQNPKATKVATATKWRREFRRRIKTGARPIIILQPFGPVAFVFDVSDTEPINPADDPLRDWVSPFRVEGRLKPSTWAYTRQHCGAEGVAVLYNDELSSRQAGRIEVVTADLRSLLPRRAAAYPYVVTLNRAHGQPEQFATLVHELGHLFCGHLLKRDPEAWWEERWHDRRADLDLRTREFEAESVAFVVCCRAGLETLSHQYLAGYARGTDVELPPFSFSAILKAIDYIEGMGKPSFKSKRKARPTS